ncbi:MAG: phosphate signaling complex protein PhoU [Planctomycetes bacterium]|nr:phosphate signaling complex protein PhoU [Planctomycetota bacterium]
MSELQERLERLSLRLDLMGMRVEQALADALAALRDGNADAGRQVYQQDSVIDREEVEIEQECIRLLALYQPAAIDLRTLCTIIKVNNDLERIADFAAGIGRSVADAVAHELSFSPSEAFQTLWQTTVDTLGRTVRMLRAADAQGARNVIASDSAIDEAYSEFARNVLDAEDRRVGGAEPALIKINVAKALERVGDLCTNIAEDIIFLRTGDIVRHAKAFGGEH